MYEDVSKKFKPSKWTTIISLCDVPLVWIGVYSILNSAWAVAIVGFVGSVGLTMFHNYALAADYAKWRQGRELHEFKEDANDRTTS